MSNEPFLCLLYVIFLSTLVLSQTSTNVPPSSPTNNQTLPINQTISINQTLSNPPTVTANGTNITSPDLITDRVISGLNITNSSSSGSNVNNTTNTSPMIKCPPGFFCPENSAQPVYCCEGYYCSRDAKNITLCPEIYCDRLAYCPPGSKKGNKFMVFLLVLIVAIVIMILFQIKKKRDELKNAKYDKLLTDQRMSLERSLDPVKRTFDIEFENLGLVLPSGIEIMRSVSGKLTQGRTCAIMGPSGAGKTTFVSLLTGKAKKTSGVVKVNGVIESLEKYRKLIGFVPQEDVMLRELTVRDILLHSALMRLPNDMPRSEKKQRVIEVIRFLELSHVMESIIGNEEQRGISGGQRKRVNIGMELVAEPSDEPTSGLDSATALEVCNLLKKIAHGQGLTVAAVIHSPSPQAFNTFDDFLLLGKGGRIVYFGPTNKAMEYFQTLGFNCPEEESPADFMMEIASGKIQPADRSDITIIDLFETWERYRESEKAAFRSPSTMHDTKIGGFEKDDEALLGEEEPPKKRRNCFVAFWQEVCIPFIHLINDIGEYIADVGSEFSEFITRTFCFYRKDPIRETPNILVAFILLFKRACIQLYRNRTQFLLDQLLHLGCGIFISLAVGNLDYVGKPPREICEITPYVVIPVCLGAHDSLQNVGVFMSLGVTFAGISAGGSTFGYEKVVYWRDTSSGMRTIPYFLAKIVADIPRLLIAALMFSLAFIIFYSFRAKLWEIYIIILFTYTAAWAMGLVSKEKLSLVGTGFALGWGMVLSGATPKLEEVNKSSYIKWLWDISAQRWAVEALYLKEIAPRLYVLNILITLGI
ncbi:6344_t:CDS:10 [Scutellospora calospora]|uniref:6344_t:CDS:1 n=1 Tax=Scutellospora calospora TaxID=85575 RepID=A0ACA9JUH2_9GLOM|nr:6344_t:CDS:10 [Scutellospora calospora]